MSEERTHERKYDKVITGSAKTKKKSEFQKFMGSFLSQDISRIKKFILYDVIRPNIKRAISEAVKTSIDMILYDDNERPAAKSNGAKVSYNKCFAGSSNQPYAKARYASGFEYDDIIFETRGDAEAVLSTMEDILTRFKVVSVGDFYDLAEVSTTNYAINKYGWNDLHDASIGRVSEGWVIRFPSVIPLQ